MTHSRCRGRLRSQDLQDGDIIIREPGEGPSRLRLLEANSASVFVRQLGLNINPAHAPPLSCYAWNLGLNKEVAYFPRPQVGILHILNAAQMRTMAAEYFSHVAPVYNFLGQEYVESEIGRRWLEQSLSDPVDAMLCGVAALGSLFSGGLPNVIEAQLVQAARGALECSTSLPSPCIDHVVGWLLRVIYLRATASPQATWMACCTLMHMIETTKLHLEPSDHWILAQSAKDCPSELRRRIYWVAQLFNTWVSSDCGKSEVELRGASSEFPSSSWTKDQLQLCRISYLLGQTLDFGPAEIDAEMSALCALSPREAMLQLLQCNIGLCFFRRLRALGRHMADASLEALLDLAESSLAVVDELLNVSCPWWHVINIPFQIVCTLLVIDTIRSLGLLGEALDVLKRVVGRYSTATAQETYEIACFLVTQERQRRSKRLEHLTTAVDGHSPSAAEPTPIAEIDVGYTPDVSASLIDQGLDLNSPLVDYFFFGHPFPQDEQLVGDWGQ